MMLRFFIVRAAAAACAAGLLLTGCGGAISELTRAPSAGVPSAAHASKATARLVIKIPHRGKTKFGTRAPRYVSPATQSLTINVTPQGSATPVSGFPQTVNLTPTSTGCSATLASTSCSLEFAISPGSYSATLSTYDQTGGSGNVLSQAQSVAFTITPGTTNSINLTLGGIPASIVVTPLQTGYLLSRGSGLSLYGPDPQPMIVEALDADQNVIAGAGAPTLTVVPSIQASLKVAGGTATSPNVFTLQAPVSGSPALVTPGTLSLAVTATPASNSGSSPISSKVPLRISHSAIYVAVQEPDEVAVFSDDNYTAPTQTITNGILGPQAVAVGSDGTLYVGQQSNILEFPAGSTTSTVTLTSQNPNAVAVNALGTVYAASNGNDQVGIFPPGSTTATTTLGSASGVTDPFGIAVDGANTIYVVNNFGGVVEIPAGQTTPSVSFTTGLADPSAAAIDAAGTLYVCDTGTREITEYPTGSTTPSVTIPNVVNGTSLAVDAAGAIFAVTEMFQVVEYPRGSNATTQPTTVIPSSVLKFGQPESVAVVPNSLSQ